jgi:uncharacterized protein HemX
MKKNQTTILTLLSITLLFVIIGISIFGFLKKKNNDLNNNLGATNVLGEAAQSLSSSSVIPNVNDIVQNTIQNTVNATKETVTQKLSEVEKTIINTINQEVANMTKSQVDALKVQICKDLGVIPSTASATPAL